jgi:hypothetical protein
MQRAWGLVCAFLCACSAETGDLGARDVSFSREAGADAGAPADAELDAGTPDAMEPEDTGFWKDIGPGPTCGARGTRTLTGTESRSHVGHTSVTEMPRAGVLRAFMFSGDCFDEYAVERTPPAEFAIASLPESGPVYLRIAESPSAYIVASENTIDIGAVVLGRPDLVEASPGTQLSLDLDGLSPWQESDDLQLYVPNLGMWGLELARLGLGGAPIDGETTVRGLILDLTSGFFLGPALIDASKGDRAFAAQLVWDGELRKLRRFGELSPMMMRDAQTTSASATLAELALTATITIDWRRSAFAALANEIHPRDVTLRNQAFFVATLPQGERGAYGPSLDLVQYVAGDQTDEARTIFYALPFETPFGLIASPTALFDVQMTRSGATGTFLVDASSTYAVADYASLVLEPLVSPVLSPTIAGRDLFTPQTSVGATPVVAWSAPRLGAPRWYHVYVYRVFAEGTRLRRERLGHLRTSETAIRLPPDLLRPGEAHLISIFAFFTDGATAVGPYSGRPPDAGASILSAIFTP